MARDRAAASGAPAGLVPTDRLRALHPGAPAPRARRRVALAPRRGDRGGGRPALRPARPAPAAPGPSRAAPGRGDRPPAPADLRGPRGNVHQVRADHGVVAGDVRRGGGRGVPLLPRHRAARAVQRGPPAGRRRARDAPSRTPSRVRPGAVRPGLDRGRPPGPPPRRADRRGQDHPPGDRAPGRHRPRPDAAALRGARPPDRGPDGGFGPPAGGRLPDPGGRGDGPAQRGPDDGALPPPAGRGRPPADRRPRALPRAVGGERPHDGAARRRPDRRPGPAWPSSGWIRAPWSRRSSAPSCHHGPLGRVPRRRPRRQHAAAARRPHRHRRLGHRRAARPRRPIGSSCGCWPRWSGTNPPGPR